MQVIEAAVFGNGHLRLPELGFPPTQCYRLRYVSGFHRSFGIKLSDVLHNLLPLQVQLGNTKCHNISGKRPRG